MRRNVRSMMIATIAIPIIFCSTTPVGTKNQSVPAVHIAEQIPDESTFIRDPKLTAVAPKNAIEEPKLAISLTKSEFDLLCRIIAAEARGESYEGQMAVAQVIRDRMEHPNQKLYGGPTLRGVVLKKGQFAKPWRGNLNKYPSVIKAAKAVFDNNERIFDEPTMFFYQPQIASRSASRSIKRYNYIGKVGAHNFHGEVIVR